MERSGVTGAIDSHASTAANGQTDTGVYPLRMEEHRCFYRAGSLHLWILGSLERTAVQLPLKQSLKMD